MENLSTLKNLVAVGVVVIVAVAVGATRATSAHPSPGVLERVVREAIIANQTTEHSGVSVAVVTRNGLVFAKGFGERDRANHSLVTEATLFQIGSTTKAFTSTLVSLAADERGFSVTEPVNSIAPNFRLTLEAPTVSAEITLEDMLSHRSGLPRHDLFAIVAPFDRQEIVRRMAFFGMNPHPGMGFREGFQYNNLMYVAAGVFLDRVTETPWDEHLRLRIFQPLAMGASYATGDYVPPAAELARPYSASDLLPFVGLSQIGPAGSIVSSAPDMGKWLTMHLTGGLAADGQEVVPRIALERTYDGRISVPDDMGQLLSPFATSWQYGLGWFVGQLADGKRLILHPGNTFGYSTAVALLPDHGYGVVVLTNQDGSALPRHVLNAVLAEIVNGKASPRQLATFSAPRAPSAAPPVRSHWPFLDDAGVERTADHRVTAPSWELRPAAATTTSSPAPVPSCNPVDGIFYHRGYGPIEIFHGESGALMGSYFSLLWTFNGATAATTLFGIPLFNRALFFPESGGGPCHGLEFELEAAAPPRFSRIGP